MKKRPKKKALANAAAELAEAEAGVPEALEGEEVTKREGFLVVDASATGWLSETGREVCASADRSDKPSRFFGWLVAPLTEERFAFLERQSAQGFADDHQFYLDETARAEYEEARFEGQWH